MKGFAWMKYCDLQDDQFFFNHPATVSAGAETKAWPEFLQLVTKCAPFLFNVLQLKVDSFNFANHENVHL